MGREITTPMAAILAGAKRDIDYTIDITLPDAQEFHFATSPLSSINGNDYENYLEKVGQIRQTLENPTDQLAVTLQNKDSGLGLNLATYWQQWRTAQAVVGRLYWEIGADGTRTGTNEWIQMFSGAVQQPVPDDLYFRFDVIPDTTSAGQIVCSKTCAGACGFVYGDLKTCGIAATALGCDHNLKSSKGCDGNNNSEHFGGTEHRYQLSVAAPGTGGNDDDEDTPPPCPRKDQYVRVRDEHGFAVPKLAGAITTDDWIWHPILRRFYPVASAEIVIDQPIWETVGPRGIRGFSSKRHPVIRNVPDVIGTAVEEMRKGDHFLVENEWLMIEAVSCKTARDTGTVGDVVRITIDARTDAEKIYCWSDSPDGSFIICHNAKNNPL